MLQWGRMNKYIRVMVQRGREEVLTPERERDC